MAVYNPDQNLDKQFEHWPSGLFTPRTSNKIHIDLQIQEQFPSDLLQSPAGFSFHICLIELFWVVFFH